MADKLTKKNAREVMTSLYALLDQDDELWASFADLLASQAEINPRFRAAMNEWLDDRLEEDAFGTEGQLDPRGDHREDD